MLPLISALATALAVAFVTLAVGRRKPSVAAVRTQARLETIKAQVRGERNAGAAPLADRIVMPAARGVGRFIVSVLPAGMLHRVSDGLVAAGRPLPTHRFVLVDTAVGGMVALFTVTIVKSAGFAVPQMVLFGAAGFFAGALLPLMWLRRRITHRRLEIWRSLPDASDLLTTCVEAGMSIDAAFARVAEEMPGQLSHEIGVMLQEIGLGRPRREALADIAVRAGVADLEGMLGAIIQADQTGTRLAPVLRTQAHHIRTERRLWAEEKARKIPAKMTIPIVFLIIPTLFILILGPLAVDIGSIFLK